MSKDITPDEEFEKLLSRLAQCPLEKSELQALERLLIDHPERQSLYLECMRLDSSLLELGQVFEDVPELALPRVRPRVAFSSRTLAWGVSAAMGLLLVVGLAVSARRDPQGLAEGNRLGKAASIGPERGPASVDAEKEPLSSARFAGAYHAVFRESRSPTSIGTHLLFSEDYILLNGMTRLVFASGAEAIVAAPAVFQVASDDELVVNLGSCSVYAPEGAEGFKVSTPTSEVIDRGTRFSVVVTEDGASNVAVVDGEAEVSSPGSNQKRTLFEDNSVRVGVDQQIVDGAEATKGNAYVSSIPDHLVSYEALPDDLGRAVKLLSLDVQRGGRRLTYREGDFILANVNHFSAKGSSGSVHGIVPADAPADEFNRFGPMNLSFVSGFINPGGEKRLRDDAIVLGAEGTPGMNLVFERPVINGPGPDIVLFDAQSIAHSLDGDVFHLYPETDAPGARAITVESYDIDGHSADAQVLSGCRLLHSSPDHAEDGSPIPLFGPTPIVHRIPSRVFGVGIDLDDMDIPRGEAITGLFLQDAVDDHDRLDPVVIVGLPPVD
ncbi:FecR protein [Planctomycetes bacterium Pan216]|uniref:FecR protein n=1 Tax=Kolteria novifilia TaxID=2527975 RepID=A0A518AZJ8_9BACT|nr:FecR protein [Planctomycetes bacterium Pan216]